MVILILGETEIFARQHEAADNAFTRFLAVQFRHSVWRGLHFWDLLLPCFMFLSGVSLAFSYEKQKRLNYPWRRSFSKIIKRCGWLLFWGVLIYSVQDNKINIQFSNVLVELSIATFISFLLINRSAAVQLFVSLGLLLITELLFRFTGIKNFDQPFVDQHNFGNYVDLIVLGHVNGNYGTTYNVIPSSVSTIWGLMVGQLLLSSRENAIKLKYMIVCAACAIAAGFILDLTNITPMLKWIASSSFIFATGGFSIAALALCYWWIDIRQHTSYLSFFTIMGQNSIFVYLFYTFIGAKWMIGFSDVLIPGILGLAGVPYTIGILFSCLAVFAFHWYLCYFLYKKKIFFKL